MKDFMLIRDGSLPVPPDPEAIRTSARAKIEEFSAWVTAQQLTGVCSIAIPMSHDTTRSESTVNGDLESVIAALAALVVAAAKTVASSADDAVSAEFSRTLFVARVGLAVHASLRANPEATP